MDYAIGCDGCENESEVDLEMYVPYRFEEGTYEHRVHLCKECMGNGKLLKLYENFKRERD